MFKREENKKLCEEILHDVANRHGMTIAEISVMPDHIHAVVGILSTLSISQAFHLLKVASAHEIFKRKSNFRHRYPGGHFWSPGKFYRTVGDADTETVIRHVRDQRLQQASLESYTSAT